MSNSSGQNELVGGVAELAYAADLKSASEKNVGSNPTAPTTRKDCAMDAWEFVDSMLAEAEAANEPCSFPPNQVTKLRQMIAEIPTPEMNGRTRKRFAHGQTLTKPRTIKMPEDIMKQIETRAILLDISFNMMLTFVCNQYLEDVDRVDFVEHFKENGGVSQWASTVERANNGSNS